MIEKTYGWDWQSFKGTPHGLKWNRRDLQSLDTVMELTPGRTAVVQGGGNLGIFPKRLAQEFNAVYSFEPDPRCFALMMVNAPEPNIIKIQAAMGFDRALVGTSHKRRDGKPVNHEGITHIAGSGIVPTLTIDDLGLTVCDLIYLDLEGYEFYALQGARETILRCRPVLAVEINKSIGFLGLSKEDIHTHIRLLDYRHAMKLHSDHVFLPAERT